MKKTSHKMQFVITLIVVVFVASSIVGCTTPNDSNEVKSPSVMTGEPLITEFQTNELKATPLPTYEPTATPDYELNKNTVANFIVKDKDGNDVELASLFGKPIVINFFATWCSPCCKELPDFQKAYRIYGTDVNFMFIAMPDGFNETVEGVKAFMQENSFDFPIYFDMDYSAGDAYSITSIPTSYFIKADGTLAMEHTGLMSALEIEQALQQIMQ